MTVRERTPAEIAALHAMEQARVAAARARRGRTARLQAIHSPPPVPSARVLAEAARDAVDVIAMRRTVLVAGVTGASIRVMAKAILELLPPDPHAARHCRDLMAAVDEHAAAGHCDDLTPWRTPAEDRWTDAELRAARQRRDQGDRDPATLNVARAADRVMRRRVRGKRTDR